MGCLLQLPHCGCTLLQVPRARPEPVGVGSVEYLGLLEPKVLCQRSQRCGRALSPLLLS